MEGPVLEKQSNGTENAVRAAGGVANIARGAAYGGMYGAAAETINPSATDQPSVAPPSANDC